ncbi:uncharacterized protein [Equus przewalskii]|uniref:Uncharacterized protein n=1 Tax=Equus przewalskii TaxID=9798 RepID=A0ABM4JF52_EQUPR
MRRGMAVTETRRARRPEVEPRPVAAERSQPSSRKSILWTEEEKESLHILKSSSGFSGFCVFGEGNPKRTDQFLNSKTMAHIWSHPMRPRVYL